jgi:hypothetical protein
MNIETRLAEILTALDAAGAVYLVMGGHAARYYGVQRTTADYDLHVSIEQWDDLDELLISIRTVVGADVQEGPSWRRRDFRRFLIGRLPDGREEWLEFWRTNHLLPPFAEVHDRREEGLYGGRHVAFLSLSDLIRSKETERECDWHDIAILEEVRDMRNLAMGKNRENEIGAMSQLRSRKGIELAMYQSLLKHREKVVEAYALCSSSISRAYLAPLLPDSYRCAVVDPGMIGEILKGPLRQVEPASAKHFALVEAVRRLYKQAAMARDREDKINAQNEDRRTGS